MFPSRKKLKIILYPLSLVTIVVYVAYYLKAGYPTFSLDGRSACSCHTTQRTPTLSLDGIASSDHHTTTAHPTTPKSDVVHGTIIGESAYAHHTTQRTPTLSLDGIASSDHRDTNTPTATAPSTTPRSDVVHGTCKDIWAPLLKTDSNYTEKVKYKVPINDVCPPLDPTSRWNEDKKVVVRSVYLNKREWNGNPTSYVFMVEIDLQVLSRNPFVKCQVGNQTSTAIDHMIPLQAGNSLNWCPHGYTHQTIVVHCYLPPDSTAGSKAVLFFKVDEKSPIVAAESEKPLVIPAPPVPSPSPDKPTIVSCIAVQYGQPPFLGEWVRYQKTIGVSHIQMIAEPSISGALKDPSVKKAIDEGFLFVDIWHKWFSAAQLYDHAQVLAYQDCLYRFQGTYDYLFPHDADDFIVLRIPEQKQLPYYVNKLCSQVGTCELAWYQMCPTCGIIRETGEDGNVTDSLAHFDRCRRSTKGIHKLPVTFDVSTHSGHKWTTGYNKIELSSNEMYVAHIRLL